MSTQAIIDTTSLIPDEVLFWFLYRWSHARVAEAKKDKAPRPDANNDLDKQKNESVHVTTVANQRYFYPGLIASSKL